MDKDVVNTAQQIHNKSLEIDALADQIDDAVIAKAKGISNYRKAIAIKSLELKEGLVETWEGLKVGKITATTERNPLAEGMCYLESYAKEEGEARYKGLITQIDAKKAILNGLQTISKIMPNIDNASKIE